MIRIISMLMALMAAGATFVLEVKFIPALTTAGAQVSVSLVLAVLLLPFVIGTIAFMLSMVGLVALVRGRQYVGFAKPSECTSFTTWASSEWNFYSGHYGRQQEGFRFFGLEGALRGELA